MLSPCCPFNTDAFPPILGFPLISDLTFPTANLVAAPVAAVATVSTATCPVIFPTIRAFSFASAFLNVV